MIPVGHWETETGKGRPSVLGEFTSRFLLWAAGAQISWDLRETGDWDIDPPAPGDMLPQATSTTGEAFWHRYRCL